MGSCFSAAPIATVEQFKSALLGIRDQKQLAESYLVMLKAQAKAPDATITATQLAAAAEYENYNAANLRYGTLGKLVAQQFHFLPETRKDGTHCWWSTLSYSNDAGGDPESGHFQFIMRPELLAALKEMHWVR